MRLASDDKPSARLGNEIRAEWALDWTKLTVNHGAFGATPRRVLAAQVEWRDRMEAQPSQFMRLVLPEARRHAADVLGQFVGAAGQDIAFVHNATDGCNAVLRSLNLQPGDEILLHSQIYGAVGNAARFAAHRSGAKIVTINLEFPSEETQSLAERVAAAIRPSTRLVIMDHVTSQSALLLPIEKIAVICRQANVPFLIDGAHGPGQIDVDLAAIGADWYVGNCHKWLAAPKGCGFLWSRPERQAHLHPTTISHGYEAGYLAEFDWVGTQDPSALLSVPAAIDFHEWLGGASLRERNRKLAHDAGRLVAEALGTEVGNPDQQVAMSMVRLPLGGEYSKERANALRLRLLEEFQTDAPLQAHGNGIWLRLSAHAYNTLEDYEALVGLCRHLVKTDQQ